MKTIAFYLKIHRKLVSQYLKSRLSFKIDTFFALLGLTFLNLLGVLSIVFIFTRIPALAGWTYYELLFMHGYMLFAILPQQLFFDSLWELSGELMWGDFILYYFRPINILFSLVSEKIDLKGFGQIFISVFLLIYAGSRIDIEWSLLKIIFAFVFFAGSSLLYLGIRIITSSTAFWLIQNISVMNFIAGMEGYGGYPIKIFPKAIKMFFTYMVPFMFLAYFPVNILLNENSFSINWLFTPAAGIIIILIAGFVWKKGIESYTGTGS